MEDNSSTVLNRSNQFQESTIMEEASVSAATGVQSDTQQATHRASIQSRLGYNPPLPSPLGVTAPTSLTNHEIYELIQRQQGLVAPTSNLSRPSTPTGNSPRGSLKQHKRKSSIFSQAQGRLERQSSIIVGTAGFRERYGESLFEEASLRGES